MKTVVPRFLDGLREVHLTLPMTTFVKLKMATFERQLSMKEAVAGFMSMVADEDKRAIGILNDLALMRYRGELKGWIERRKLSNTDTDLLYEMLEKGYERT